MRLNSPQINIITKACLKASRSLIRDFGEIENLQVATKAPGDFVTSADQRTEKILINELQKAHPDYGIVTEESGIINKDNNKNRWIIDPIDGTSNFLHGIPHFAISIALKSNKEIVSGLVFDPIKNEMFYGEKNNGAYFNNQRIRVSKKKNLDECLFATGGKNEILNSLNVRKTGSAALDMAYVGAGRFDGYFQKNLNIWDVAAGIIIVNEAGGKINNINYSSKEVIKILAGSNSVYDKMIENLNNF